MSSNAKTDITGFTLLSSYESSDDLIEFKGGKFQPQITIYAILPKDGTVYNFALSATRGFKPVIYKDGNIMDCADDVVILLNASLDHPDGSQQVISMNLHP